MKTLHLLRSKNDGISKEITLGFISAENDSVIYLDEEELDYSFVLEKIFENQKIICWW